MAVGQKNDARLDFRLSRAHKEIIERAARISGQSVSDFAVSTLMKSAQEVLESHQILRLSNRDFDAFMAALDSEEEPNETLKQAAEDYKQWLAEGGKSR